VPEYDYLLVGGGMAADSAARGIREVDSDGTIGLISSEETEPYERPFLSKVLWASSDEEGLFRDTAALGVTLHLGRQAVSIDRSSRTVRDDGGTVYRYGKLLLATGGTPRRLKGSDEGVLYYRSLAHYRRLRELTAEPGQEVLIIGGGYIGAELAAALVQAQQEVTMAFPEEGIMERLLPEDLSAFVSDYYRERGVKLLNGQLVESVVRTAAGRKLVTFTDGSTLEADVVVAGLGIIPDTRLADEAGLETADGIRVNATLQTSDPDIYAAGDAAAIHSGMLNRWRRVEHEENANLTGFFAGQAMAGEPQEYTHLPMFYSDLFDLGFEGAGIADSSLETVSEWDGATFGSGTIWYLEEGIPVGVIMWNRWGKLEEARERISRGEPLGRDTP